MLDLDDIKARLAEYERHTGESQFLNAFDSDDISALIAEVERLRAEVNDHLDSWAERGYPVPENNWYR